MRKICQRVTFRGDCLSLVTLPITRHDKFYLNNVDYHGILYEITDPEKLKFVGTDKLYGCHTCGWTWLSSDPMIRRQEKIQTMLYKNSVKNRNN